MNKLIMIFLVVASVSAEAEGNRPRLGPQFTDEQKSCLESKVGKPGSGIRPSREAMETAFKDCGIQIPEFKGGDHPRPHKKRRDSGGNK